MSVTQNGTINENQHHASRHDAGFLYLCSLKITPEGCYFTSRKECALSLLPSPLQLLAGKLAASLLHILSP